MSPRAIAMHILMQVARRASFPDALLDIYFKEHPELGGRDRALITELVYGVLRWQGRLDWVIDQHLQLPGRKMVRAVRIILRLAVYQLLFLDRVPAAAAVDEAVKLAKASQSREVVGFVNAVLRSIARKRRALQEAAPAGPLQERLAVRYSYPLWLVERWLNELGQEETEALCEAGNQVAPTTIRVNTLKATAAAVAADLKIQGLAVEAGRYAPEALHLKGIRLDLSSLPSYRRGEFQVQDEGAQLVAHLVRPRAGEWVLDACAGLGAKCTHLAQLMENRGRITAVDRYGWKLSLLVENARRLQISCIRPLAGDLFRPDLFGGQGPFDRILLDAPCSGLGVLRRNPDLKWKIKPKDFYRLHLLQSRMLGRVASLVRPGGVLVYATCTLSGEENQGTVEAFLQKHRHFHLEPARPFLPAGCDELVDSSGGLRTWPHRHGVDGFFAVRLRRRL